MTPFTIFKTSLVFTVAMISAYKYKQTEPILLRPYNKLNTEDNITLNKLTSNSKDPLIREQAISKWNEDAYHQLDEHFKYQRSITNLSRRECSFQTSNDTYWWHKLEMLAKASKIERLRTSATISDIHFLQTSANGLFNSTTFLYGIVAFGGFKLFFRNRAQSQFPTYFVNPKPEYYQPPTHPLQAPPSHCCKDHS